MNTLINTESAAYDLAHALFSPKRKSTVIVISQRLDKTGPVISGDKVQEALGPLVRVFTLSGCARRYFNNALDNIFGIEPSGVRLYLPRMRPNDTPSRHPVWNQWKVDEHESPQHFIEVLKGICDKRQEFQRTHTISPRRPLTIQEANALFHAAPPAYKRTTPEFERVVVKRHPTSGRKVLHAVQPKPPAPSPDQLAALCQKFSRS